MPLTRNSIVAAAMLLCCSPPVLADGVAATNGHAAEPARIGATLLVIGSEVIRDQWPGTLPLVNAPEGREIALPGQCLSVAVRAEGDGRDALLTESTYSFEISFAGQTRKFEGLHPAAVKHIKQAAAFAVAASGAAGAPDFSKMSLATFDLNWCVPTDAHDGKAAISGAATLPGGAALGFEQASVPVESMAHAAQRGGFNGKEEVEEWFMGYHRQPNPARVLAACRVLMHDEMAFALNVRTFLIEVLKSSPAAAADLAARLVDEKPEVRGYALYLLKEAGYDVAPVLARLPEDERAFREQFLAHVPPLDDPYDLTVDPAHFDTADRMDALWSIFLATGTPKPVRAIAGLLAWRGDYPALREAQQTPEEHKVLTAALGRGVCYITAGWSLGSFVRSDGLVADFVDAWKADPATPAVLKEELGGLLSNQAFRRAP